MLYKVTGADHSVCVRVVVVVVVGGGSEFSGAWCKRGEGARTGGSSAS